MPASPIARDIETMPDHWVHLQKTMIPDTETSCYWSVWYDPPTKDTALFSNIGRAWLMWCPFNENPSVNDNWGHAEEIDESCRNVLTAIEAIYKVSFHDSIWVEIPSREIVSS